jgi:hypothetical protein
VGLMSHGLDLHEVPLYRVPACRGCANCSTAPRFPHRKEAYASGEPPPLGNGTPVFDRGTGCARWSIP